MSSPAIARSSAAVVASRSSATISAVRSSAPSARPARPASALRVADPAGPQRRAGLLELVTGGEHGDRGADRAGDLAAADRGQHPDLGRPELHAGAQHAVPSLDVLARAADVVARLDRDPNGDALVAVVGVLDPDHCVGAGRDHRSGGDLDRLPGSEFAI